MDTKTSTIPLILFITLAHQLFTTEITAKFSPRGKYQQIQKAQAEEKKIIALDKKIHQEEQALNQARCYQVQALNFIQQDYGAFISTYKQIKNTCVNHHMGLTQMLLSNIYQAIAFDKLTFYGNFCSRIHRNMQLDVVRDQSNPLRAFESVYLVDTIGHLNKHCKNKGTPLDNQAEELINLFSEMRCFIQSTKEYSIELLKAKKTALKDLSKDLKRTMKNLSKSLRKI